MCASEGQKEAREDAAVNKAESCKEKAVARMALGDPGEDFRATPFSESPT